MLPTILRQPLLHFLLIGAGIFAAYAFLNPPRSIKPNDSIVVSRDHAARLAAVFERTWRRKPTMTELTGLIDSYIREEILVREARSLGLDENDTVIRQRLSQKMTFLIESAAAALAPDQAELQEFHEEHADRYRVPARLALQQIFLGNGTDRERVQTVKALLEEGADHHELGERTLLPPELGLSYRQTIDGTFGEGFFDRLLKEEPGRWFGPVRSAYGDHFVRITGRLEGQILPLQEIGERVEGDWRRQKAGELVEAEVEASLKQFEVIRPDPADMEALAQ